MNDIERRLDRLASDFSRREYTLLLGAIRRNARRHPEQAEYWSRQRSRLQQIQQQQQRPAERFWEGEEYRFLSQWIHDVTERYDQGEEDVRAELESVIAII